jgi:hypothetical protein
MSRCSSKNFFQIAELSFFLLLPLTTEAMGICPPAGGGSIRCPSADGQSECGSKTAGMHISQPMNMEYVLGVRRLFSFYLAIYSIFIYFQYKKIPLNTCI